MDKVASPSIIPKIPSIIQEVSAAIETDMSISKMAVSYTHLDVYKRQTQGKSGPKPRQRA